MDIPSSGEYLLDGKSVAELDDDSLSEIRGKKIGFIFQSYHLLPQLTLLENIMLPLIYQKVDNVEGEKKARELASLVGLDHRLGHKPSELSGGQQQRVAIARALINDPVLILADEPTGNLDSETEAEILALFIQLNKMDKTIAVVTHEQVVADCAKEVIEMRDGLIISHKKNKKSQAKL